MHVDDALLAFTVALSAPDSFEGGGTYFEYIDRVVEMAQGHATFRPGGVRHGGHPVSRGLRYTMVLLPSISHGGGSKPGGGGTST